MYDCSYFNSGFTNVPLILLGGLALGLIMSISPAFVQKYMVLLTGNDKVALGHFSALGYWLSGFVGGLVGDRSKSTEDIHFPKSLAFLRDSTVSITISMTIIYVIVALFAGSTYIETELSSGTSSLVYALQLAGQFAAGVFVILAGVRLILGEIVPAFKGISERLVPNSKPALDCPIVYPYAPNAVLIGFISSFVGGLVSMVIMIFTGSVVILPGVVPHFFCGATAGVIGNASGGVRGATIGAFCQGVLISFLPVFLMPVLGGLGFEGSTFSDADFGLSGIILGMLNKFGSQTGIIIGLLAILAGIVVFSFVKKTETKEG